MFSKHEHIPIWRSHRFDFARSFVGGVELFWTSNWTGALLIAGFLIVAVYWHFNIPGPGKAVAALALAAAVMTLRAMTGLEKSSWMIVLFILLSAENRSIDKERAESNERQNSAAQANQREFSATMDKMSGLADQAAKSLCEANGCDSFCYFGMDDAGRPAVIQAGRYPLYVVEVRIVDPANLKQNLIGTTLRVGDLSVGKVWFGLAPLPIGKDKADFNVSITAKNGFWQEEFKMRKVDGKWERATIVQPLVFKPDQTPTTLPFRKITPGFPASELTWK